MANYWPKRQVCLSDEEILGRQTASIAVLDKPPVIVRPIPQARPARQRERVSIVRKGDGALTERYRPARLAELIGQDSARRVLAAFVARPYPVTFLFEGDTGTGKTSAALALANELGCAVESQEFGGVWQIASGEQSVDAVRKTAERMHFIPMMGSGWRVFIINECDRMAPAAETVWLDRLESLPPHTVVVFTTNYTDKLSQRFVDRCVTVHFESQAAKIRNAVEDLIVSIYADETGIVPDDRLVSDLADRATKGSRLSFRRAVQLLQAEIPAA